MKKCFEYPVKPIELLRWITPASEKFHTLCKSAREWAMDNLEEEYIRPRWGRMFLESLILKTYDSYWSHTATYYLGYS